MTKKLRGAQRDRRTHASLELALLLLFALLAFSASERAGLSGIMALFFCAVGMRHYTLYNTSKASQRSARVLLTTLSETSEACLATLLGVAFVDYLVKALDDDGGFHRLLSPASFGFDRLLSSEDSGAATAADATHMRHHHAGAPVVWDVPFLALGLPILLLSRALNVFPLAFIANLCRPPEQRISLRMQIVIWFSGMRGAVSFALAITLPGAGALHGGSPDATWAVPANDYDAWDDCSNESASGAAHWSAHPFARSAGRRRAPGEHEQRLDARVGERQPHAQRPASLTLCRRCHVATSSWRMS